MTGDLYVPLRQHEGYLLTYMYLFHITNSVTIVSEEKWTQDRIQGAGEMANENGSIVICHTDNNECVKKRPFLVGIC